MSYGSYRHFCSTLSVFFGPRLPRPFCFLPSVSSRTNSTLVGTACHCVCVFFFFGVV
ncbi:hypothetical protein GHT06_022657 [Daphnia sinensis]|uniref:Uncharacterized protein n=1 Tax=Daphnia sinensis TaxID=1820382 RepID=A0AAD5KYF3_9CRUS|nr:hypothetical protein GHT06_022657 [Daphnia sinensis]